MDFPSHPAGLCVGSCRTPLGVRESPPARSAPTVHSFSAAPDEGSRGFRCIVSFHFVAFHFISCVAFHFRGGWVPCNRATMQRNQPPSGGESRVGTGSGPPLRTVHSVLPRLRRCQVATSPLPPGLANDQPGRSPRESPRERGAETRKISNPAARIEHPGYVQTRHSPARR
jgi:hypothetical protein